MSNDTIINLFSGTVAGVAAAIVTHPLEIARIRLQLSVSGTQPWNAQRLFNGLSAATAREAIFCGLRLGVYDSAKCWYSEVIPYPFIVRLVAGGTSGLMGTLASHPIEIIKVVKIYSPPGTGYPTIIKNLATHKQFFRALLPAAQRSILFSSSQLTTYDYCRGTISRYCVGLDQQIAIVLSSWASALVSTLLASPLEVVKVRMIGQGVSSASECLQCIIKYDGVRALWRGAGIMWFRVGPYTMVQLWCWEHLRGALREG